MPTSFESETVCEGKDLRILKTGFSRPALILCSPFFEGSFHDFRDPPAQISSSNTKAERKKYITSRMLYALLHLWQPKE